MENEKKVSESNETSLNKRDYSKEIWYLNQFKDLINFNIYEESTYCEDNFYSTIARYIDYLQKNLQIDREQQIQKLIDSIKNFSWNEIEKLKRIYLFFYDKKINRYEANWMKTNASALRLARNDINARERRYIPNKNWKIDAIFPWIVSKAIPERYYTRFSQSWMESKVINENRKNFVDSMKKQREKADELAKKL